MVSQNVSRFNDSGLKRGTSTAAAAAEGARHTDSETVEFA
jgi:hypothetical protein